MKNRFRHYAVLLMIVVGFGLFFACSKENSGNNTLPAGQQNVSLYLTDDPAFFDKVFIDIKSVQVLVDTCSANRHHFEEHHMNLGDTCVVWHNLNVTPGVYDLLTLRNGVDTLLAAGNLPLGKIVAVKISLGTNNSLVKDSVTYPLHLAANSDAAILIGLRGNEWEEHLPGHFRLWFDFDIARSIIKNHDGQFVLTPFIKCFVVNKKGNLSGRVLPGDAAPVISVFSATDTAYALPNHGGEFKVRGLSDGNYTVFVNASHGYRDTTISNITVSQGKEVKIGTITLHK